jgi:hypothetical protein
MRFSNVPGGVPPKDIGRPDTQHSAKYYRRLVFWVNYMFLVRMNVSFS